MSNLYYVVDGVKYNVYDGYINLDDGRQLILNNVDNNITISYGDKDKEYLPGPTLMFRIKE